jgi:MFS family permease
MAIFMGNNGSLGAVYAGRFIAGLGVGQTVVVAPVYLAEIVSPNITTPLLPSLPAIKKLNSNLT